MSTLSFASVSLPVKEWSVHVAESVIDSGLSDQAFRLLMVLEAYTRSKSECWPSNEELCRRTGKRRTAIADALHELERAGWIALEYQDPETKRHRTAIRSLKRTGPPLIPEKRYPDTGKAASRCRKSGNSDTGKPAQKYSGLKKTERTTPAVGPAVPQAAGPPSSKEEPQPEPPPEFWQAYQGHKPTRGNGWPCT
ncbi:MAG: helix-turn-helix domain-containing protein [Planctomycetaceae bacterium]|nr:helix-turn-helix domain-containing protein [Planctomycetaceae bacterium]